MRNSRLTLFIKKFFLVIIFLFLISRNALAEQVNGIDVNLNVGSCNNNNICEAGNEDFFNCPLDCTPIIVVPGDGKGGSNGSSVVGNIFSNLTVEVSYNSAIIKWKSAIPTRSSIKWGTNQDYKDGTLQNINFLLNHSVLLSNLSDGTVYYFNIDATCLLGKTYSLENQVFRTLSLLDTTPPGNSTKVKASSGLPGITVSWENPPDLDFDYIRVLKNVNRYYASPSMGHVVYEGKGNYFTDSKVQAGVKYFYSLFARDRVGNYSSGSMINITHNPNGKDTWGVDLPPIIKVEPISSKYIVTQGSSFYDFKMGHILSLSGDQPIDIKTNYASLTLDDDMWIEIRDIDKNITGQYFFYRLRDKEGYTNVTIPFFEREGRYDVTIHRYSSGLDQVVNVGVFQITKATGDSVYSFSWFSLWFILSILLILIILAIIIYKIHQRYKKHMASKEQQDSNQNDLNILNGQTTVV